MAVPRVFVSSTCYDLKYIRENLKYFINNMGYESVLSEEGDVFYAPDQHTHDSCLLEVHNCQIFVLIIGGRFGGNYLQEDKSITNKEYEEAIKCKIPVFALVDKNVWSDHFVYQKNKKDGKADSIIYPNVDNVKIFSFIDEVRKNENNNAIYPFGDYHDIERYLKKQWAGLLYKFLSNTIETRTVKDLFEEIHNATEKIEYYTRHLAVQVGDAYTNALIKCYDIMLGCEVVQNIRVCWGVEVTPHKVIAISDMDDLCNNQILHDEEECFRINHGGPPYRCSKALYDNYKRQYSIIREKLLQVLQDNNLTVEDFLEKENC